MSLEHLWAGWRSDYIVSAAQGGNQAPAGESGSVFSRILASGLSDDECNIVFRGVTCFAILNAFPYNSGHVLVMPYREVADLEFLSGPEHAELFALVVTAVRAVKSAYRPHGVNVGFNLGEAAGAGVTGHLHAHVVPRWNADSNFMTSVAETRVLPEALPVTLAKLRAAWPSGESTPSLTS